MPKTILLTGATGFLGSHLLEGLIIEGYSVVILKRSFSDTWRIDHLIEQVYSYNIDRETLETPFKEHTIDTVIHTATVYGRNNESISEIVDFNVLFSLKLLETAISFKTNTFFNTDTLQQKYLSNYTLSKKQFVQWLKILSETNRIKAINLKIEHMYGPKDDKKKFVVWLIEQMLSDNLEIELTSGEQKRDFIYVNDVVNAFLVLLRQIKFSSYFNEFDIGTGKQIRVRDFVNLLKDTIESVENKSIKPRLNFGVLPYRKGELMEVIEDTDPIFNLGWEPNMKLSKGLELVVRDFCVRKYIKQ